jgi:hypothetical protein
MEVHAHSHAHGKKTWKSYIWEFLMLFLAVFCGFLAEYQLEHKIEKDKEKEFIRSLAEDLAEDTTAFNEIVEAHFVNIAMMDSLKNLLCSDSATAHTAELYYWGRWASRGKWLTLHDRTIQQMKNSGGFRLIRNQKVAKAIIEYYNKLTFIEAIQSTDQDESQEFRKMAISVFHPVDVDNMISPDNDIIKPIGNPALLTTNKQDLIRLAGMVSYIKNSRLAQANSEKKMNQNAIELLELLKKEYHLE